MNISHSAHTLPLHVSLPIRAQRIRLGATAQACAQTQAGSEREGNLARGNGADRYDHGRSARRRRLNGAHREQEVSFKGSGEQIREETARESGDGGYIKTGRTFECTVRATSVSYQSTDGA
ncbi:hypothetical protein HYPSUDRAFT_47446 [Hypholoma sublateritium FD-334 SS-4]|uniref:Uncharacterized protein n=1 Tax=Hypholoma sublateritium (strain FD-334 SS-4) TaxID=945553 RepID=A0A0D2LZK3_HYPSF|nr:hypothetical protein HYPSUDRAFT_47446 [Hypholoma sublateritium FD-334 SS-4]